MNKYKSDDYKLGAVKYYLKQNDSMDKVCKILYILSDEQIYNKLLNIHGFLIIIGTLLEVA